MFRAMLRGMPRSRAILAASGATAAAVAGAGGPTALCQYMAPQRSNPEWKQQMKDGKLMMGCAINTSSSLVAELASSTGFDFIIIDHQHSAVNGETLRYLISAVQAGGAKAFVRVGGHLDRLGIQQSFDLGADGILVPCVNTAEDVKLAVSCAKYPVQGPGSEGGTRSIYFNLRPQLPGGFPSLFEYVNERANKETIVMVQIETDDALQNVEAICEVPGLDGAFIGPGDLATSMGLVKEVGMPGCWAHPKFDAAVKRVAAACKKTGVTAGFWNADVKGKGEMGFGFMVVETDIGALQSTLAASLKEKQEIRAKMGRA